MSLYQQILNDATGALRAKDELKLSVLRGIKTAFTNELISKNSSLAELPDEEAEKIIKRLLKQRKESAEGFERGGRRDLAETELKEAEILKSYLPPEISEEEVEEVARKKIVELKIEDKAKIGILIGAVMKELKGRADGEVVKKIILKLLV